MKILTHWKVLILVLMVLASAAAVGLKSGPKAGVEVAFVSESSPAKNLINQGMIITEVNGNPVNTINDWFSATANLKGDATIIANGDEFQIKVNDTLGLDVLDVQNLNLDFGLDLRGGTRVILKPKTNISADVVENIKQTLQTRANLYGLKEIKFKTISDLEKNNYIQVEASGIGSDIVTNLLATTGKFEAKVSKPAYFPNNNSAVFQLGQKQHTVEQSGDTLQIEGKQLKPGDNFELDSIKFQYLNRTADTALFLANVYEGKDIELIYSDPQRSGIQQAGQNVWRFYFGVLVSAQGAEKFAKVTSGIPSIPDASGEAYLQDSEIFIYLDDKLVTSLRIGSELGGKAYTDPQISGSRETRKEAIEEKLYLQTILRSGSIQTGLDIVSIDIISPTLGSGFVRSSAYVGLLAGFAVFLVIIARYRKPKFALPMFFVTLSEIIIVLGVAAINDSRIWIGILVVNLLIILAALLKKQEMDIFSVLGALTIPLLGAGLSWTIDLPAIAGIIAAIGTGIDHQIIILDETLTGHARRIYGLKDKIKTAFFIIFGAAGTMVAAMLPLIFLVAEFVKGFAITTIIGVWIGISVTRPAYARIIESLSKEKGLVSN